MAKSCKPNFFIIGAAKAATTFLSSLLELHPQASIVRGKEVHFFSQDDRYALGWDEYLKLFGHCGQAKAIGDASTSYSRIRTYPYVVKRIQWHVPDAKIIYMVRHPIKRMESAYVEHICTPGGQVFASVNEAVRRMPMIIDSSRYWEVYDAYRQVFGEAKIKIVWFEEFVTRPLPIFSDVCRFLEIDDWQSPELDRARTNPRENAASRLAQLGRDNVRVDTAWDEAVLKWVMDQIGEDNRRFLAHFGRPYDYWMQSRMTFAVPRGAA